MTIANIFVTKVRLELTLPNGNQLLRLAGLPIPPLGQIQDSFVGLNHLVLCMRQNFNRFVCSNYLLVHLVGFEPTTSTL
jgi:hypothetical protein